MKLENKIITGLATSDEDTSITIKGFNSNHMAKLFEDIANKGISVDMISQTAPVDERIGLSFTIPKEELNECRVVVSRYASDKEVIIDDNITKFSLVGLGMKNTHGVASRVFKIFNENNIGIKLITTSEIRITCAIDSKDKQVAIDKIAREFDL